MRRALILGITGQDGSYLAELLLEKGYEVHGVVRRTSSIHRSRLHHLYEDDAIYNRRLFLHYADLDDPTTMRRVLAKACPEELYHLAGQSHVGLSFEIPESTCQLTAIGTLRLLEMIRDMPKPPRLYHASSSEVFGTPAVSPQDESTPFVPVSPYGCAKAFATQVVSVYRKSFDLFACNGIMYNHESPRRGENFVTRKICRAAAAIKLGLEQELVMGDTEARRDWGDARDFVQGMWLTLQHETPEDFVFGTGVTRSVREVIECAFDAVKLDWHAHVKQDPRFLRPNESSNLVANPEKARRLLNWTPKARFEDLIREMTLAEIDALERRPC